MKRLTPADDELVALVQAPERFASFLPKRRRGARVNASTFYRWSNGEVNGVRLATVQVGGTRCTSLSLLRQFFADCAAASSVPIRKKRAAGKPKGARRAG